MAGTILVVDDEIDMQKLLKRSLESAMDCKVETASSGEMALQMLAKIRFDLVLADIKMPGMDGLELLELIKRETPDVTVIMMTAFGSIDTAVEAMKLGAFDYITKPISPKTLESRVSTHLALTQQASELKEAHALIQQQQQRMQNELNVARDIQLSMVPTVFPQDEAIDIFATLKPAREIGGDFYDAFMIDNESLCLCVGDVSGKGAPAALFMAMTKTLIKSYASSDFSTASIMTRVNDELCEGNDENLFVTVFLAILNIHTGDLRFTNAGHNYPYIIKEDKSLVTLNQKHGPVVAAMDGLVYKEDIITLSKFDTLFLYTDGVTEAMNSEEELYSEKRLENFLLGHDCKDVETNVNLLMQDISDYENSADQTDDITVLSCFYSGQSVLASLNISIENKLENITLVNESFDAFCEENQIGTAANQKVNLALDDLINNIISYGYNDENIHTIDIAFKRMENELIIVIEDDAVPFNPFDAETDDSHLSIEERGIGGLGIHLVKNLMHSCQYQRKANKNVVALTIQL